MKILINTQYSGLNFSYHALERFNELSGSTYVPFCSIENIGNHIELMEYCDEPYIDHLEIVLKSPDDSECENWASCNFGDIPRNDPNLIQLFEEFGENISDEHLYKQLKIIEIPDNSKWYIQSQDVGGEVVIVRNIKINREKLFQYSDHSLDFICDMLENEKDLVEYSEQWYD